MNGAIIHLTGFIYSNELVMLVDNNQVLYNRNNVILNILANGKEGKHIQQGIYEIGHYGCSDFLSNYDEYSQNLSINCYGVCDDYNQILEQCPELNDVNREFTITITPVLKSEQSSSGGWRWHKWGPYIGNQIPTCEYLFDESNIDKIYVYHIYEKQL